MALPKVRIAWRPTGCRRYEVYFDKKGHGETEVVSEPAMVGAGDRMSYGHPGVRANLGAGLHPHPCPIDFDSDGKMDLIISTRRDKEPFNGVYLFRNIGTNKDPLFDRGEWMGPGQKGIVVADINGDGAPDVVISDPDPRRGYNRNIRSGYFDDVRRNRLSKFVRMDLKQPYKITRDPLRYPVDWDGDGRIDLSWASTTGPATAGTMPSTKRERGSATAENHGRHGFRSAPPLLTRRPADSVRE